MKFLVEIDITPECSQCKHAEFSERIESDTIYCTKSGKKKIAVEPCEEFFVYDFLNDISGKNWELLKMEKKA